MKIILACAIGILGLVDWLWALSVNLKFSGFATLVGICFLLIAIGLYYGLAGRNKKLSDMGYYAALGIAFMASGVIFTYLTATLQFPFYDASFAKFDASIGFNWVKIYAFLAEYPRFNGLLGWAYDSMYVQLFGSVLYFAHKQWTRKNDELLGIAFVSLIISAILSGIFPAVCAWHYFDLGVERSVHLSHLLALRDGTATEFLIDQMQGIVTLPSYHTVIALLLIYMYRGQKRVFMFMLALNILMLMSVPISGGHYLIDMVAAGLVFVFSIVVVRYVMRSVDHTQVTAGVRPAPQLVQAENFSVN